VNDLPDMDELLRTSDRSERSRYLQLGLILIAASVGLFLATRSLFAGQMTFLAPATFAIGVLFVVRAFVRSTR
jgi:hypothetical protein